MRSLNRGILAKSLTCVFIAVAAVSAATAQQLKSDSKKPGYGETPPDPIGNIASIGPHEAEFPVGKTINLSSRAGVAVTPGFGSPSYRFDLRHSLHSEKGEEVPIKGVSTSVSLVKGQVERMFLESEYESPKTGKYKFTARLTAQELPGGRVRTLDEKNTSFTVR